MVCCVTKNFYYGNDTLDEYINFVKRKSFPFKKILKTGTGIYMYKKKKNYKYINQSGVED